MQKIKEYRETILVALIILAAAFSFYWYEWRPSNIVATCFREAVYGSSADWTGYDPFSEGGFTDVNEENFKWCLRYHGVK